MIFFVVFGWSLAALALCGAVYTVMAALFAGHYAPRSEPGASAPPAKTKSQSPSLIILDPIPIA